MANYPAPIDIPKGKILLAEYRDVNGTNRAITEKIAEAYGPHVAIRTMVRLEWSSPGFEIAGSCARWTNGFWAVRFNKDGATHGRKFTNDDKGEGEAREHFARLTATN